MFFKTQFQKGRISYIINCKHLENINYTIQHIKFNLNNLINSSLALKLKFYREGMSKEKESKYTNFIQGNLNQKENKAFYEYINKENIFKINNKSLINIFFFIIISINYS